MTDKRKNFTVISGGSSVGTDTKDFDKITLNEKEFHNALGLFLMKMEMTKMAVGMTAQMTGEKPTPAEAKDLIFNAAEDIVGLLKKSGVEITKEAIQ
jgi:hypothetical protein